MPGVLDPALLLRACAGSDALYGEDDEIFAPGGGGWRLPPTPDETEGSSGDDEAQPLGAVFGWAELEAPHAFSPTSEYDAEDGSDGARRPTAAPCDTQPCAATAVSARLSRCFCALPALTRPTRRLASARGVSGAAGTRGGRHQTSGLVMQDGQLRRPRAAAQGGRRGGGLHHQERQEDASEERLPRRAPAPVGCVAAVTARGNPPLCFRLCENCAATRVRLTHTCMQASSRRRFATRSTPRASGWCVLGARSESAARVVVAAYRAAFRR